MNLTAINSRLSERRVAMLAGAVEKLEVGVAVGSIRNVDFNDAKDTANRAIEEAAEAFLATGPRHAQHPSQSDWWLTAYGSDAFVSGAHGVPAALKRAQKVDALKEYAAFIASALLPIADLLTAAKPLIVKLQDQPKVVSPKQAAKLARSMTCQCCGRAIFAETGVIAHHGYQRPGGGWQTASCMGARELPFEVSRDALGRLIVNLQDWEARAVAARAAVAAETAPVVVTVSDTSKPRDPQTGRRPILTIELTRATDVAATGLKGTFDEYKTSDMLARDREIAGVRDEIKAQQARFDGWKKTHDRDDASQTWKAV
jgi:hypothetical protein